MKERARVAMDPAEVRDLLAAHAKMQLATLNPDGAPHLVTMYYAFVDEQIAFWTYRASQKARNLARDPRLTCLVEDGENYFELRGVQVAGHVEPVDDVAAVGRLIAARMPGLGLPAGDAGVLDDYVSHAAAKRVAYRVRPTRVTSWDHRRLVG